jgi:hypothetical protein
VARFRRHVYVPFVVVSIVVLVSADSAAQTPRAWPGDLHVAADLRPFADLAWEHSPTFRDQCRKLAAARAYVIVDAASARELWRADTHIRVTRDGATFARSRVRPTSNAVELIAHELEHVLESLDGVKLIMEAPRGGSRVSRNGGAYETRRATDAGRRVAQEVRDAQLTARPASP